MKNSVWILIVVGLIAVGSYFQIVNARNNIDNLDQVYEEQGIEMTDEMLDWMEIVQSALIPITIAFYIVGLGFGYLVNFVIVKIGKADYNLKQLLVDYLIAGVVSSTVGMMLLQFGTDLVITGYIETFLNLGLFLGLAYLNIKERKVPFMLIRTGLTLALLLLSVATSAMFSGGL